MDILLDFDGTCVSHKFPDIGDDIGSVPVLKRLIGNGHRLILFTMRSYKDSSLDDAINWFEENDIPLYGIQEHPEQHIWTESPKAYGQLIIDDICLGIPLAMDPDKSHKPFVYWPEVEKYLEQRGLL